MRAEAASEAPGRGRRGRPLGGDAQVTRDRILREARACFAAYGYEGTTIRMIADRAGLATAPIYHHFGSKAEVMLAVHRANYEVYAASMKVAIDAAGTFAEKIGALLQGIHDTVRLDPEQVSFAAVSQIEAGRHAELREIAEDPTFVAIFTGIVQFGVRSGALAAADAAKAQGALAATAMGLGLMSQQVSVRAHRVATLGCIESLTGTLLTQSAGSRRRSSQPKP